MIKREVVSVQTESQVEKPDAVVELVEQGLILPRIRKRSVIKMWEVEPGS
jgi:hypothetical protein